MKQYRPYNKRAISKVMENTAIGFDIMKPFQWWDTGAKELEKTTLGKAVTAPIRIPEVVVSSGVKTVKEVPVTVKKVSNFVPLLLISAAIVGTAVIVYKFNIGKRRISQGEIE